MRGSRVGALGTIFININLSIILHNYGDLLIARTKPRDSHPSQTL